MIKAGEPQDVAPEIVLLKRVKWLGDGFRDKHLSHVFVSRAGEGSADQTDSVSITTHFPGTGEILSETVHDEPPRIPHIRREELRDGVRVGSITFISPRGAVVNSWPSAASLIPKRGEMVLVTIEDAES